MPFKGAKKQKRRCTPSASLLVHAFTQAGKHDHHLLRHAFHGPGDFKILLSIG
jgi:hypothetical protein